MPPSQHVCLVCGYNMIGDRPDRCPFCGAYHDQFLSADECSARFRVQSSPVTERVTRLNSVPDLGIEHAAYRVETGRKTFWIDCPSSFDRRLTPVDIITFTHKDFLGASNQYRELFGAEVWIHEQDAEHPLARAFPFDRRFQGDFLESGIDAYHIDGHTPGFTVYFFEDLLFVCDLVFPGDTDARFNPYGPHAATVAAGRKLQTLLALRPVRTVCGWNYVADYTDWKPKFDRLLAAETI